MRKFILIGLLIFPALLLIYPCDAQAAGLSFHWGVGTGIILPESQAFPFKGLAEISIGWMSFRTSFEFSSLFGVSLIPIDETILMQFEYGIRPYIGLGGGILIMQSSFGSTTEFTFNTLGGIKIRLWPLFLFTQLKLRVSGKRGLTYQLDMGVIF